MNIKKFLSILFLIYASSNIVAQVDDYTADAAEVDFYSPGILANDVNEQVNFLICFLQSVNFSTFLDKGVYTALTDEAKCRNASGADASSDQAAATGGSASSGEGGGAASGNEVETVDYTLGTYNMTTEGNTAQGLGWVDLESMEINDQIVPSTVYVKTIVTEDASDTNRFGSFEMHFHITNKEVFNGIPANTKLYAGVLTVNNSQIDFFEEGGDDPPISVSVDMSDPNDIQGYLVSNLDTFDSSQNQKLYAVEHQIHVNVGANLYCQKFVQAEEYQRVGAAQTLVASGTKINGTDFKALIDAASDTRSTGGNDATVTGEHCWDTRTSEAMVTVYEYGTYKSDTTGSRLDLTTPAMSLEANPADNAGLTKSIYSWASYWGVHVDKDDRSNVSPTIKFKNQRDNNDNNDYSLRKTYYEIEKRSRQYVSLGDLDGVSFQMYVQFLQDDTTWSTKFANLGGVANVPTTGTCSASGRTCPEYNGYISVTGTTPADVTFVFTHGMDWSQNVMPFKLDTNFSFTAADWFGGMVDGSYGQDMNFWDPDSHQSYSIPHSAFNVFSATLDDNKARTMIETKMDIDTLKTELDADTATNFICLSECLGAAEVNASMDAARGAITSDPPASPSTTLAGPYKDIGPYHKEDYYRDENTTNNTQDADPAEPTRLAGSYNNIGGTLFTEAALYTIADVAGELYINDGSGNLTYSTDNANFVDARGHDDSLSSYRYYTKPSSYTFDNYAHNFGWAFNMRMVLNNTANRTALTCDENDDNNARGYDALLKSVASNALMHTSGSGQYACQHELYSGGIDTIYSIRLKQRPDYRLFNTTANAYATISAPETVEYTVPAAGSALAPTYNFSNTDLAGQKFKLKYEGFGAIHNFPGRVVDMSDGTDKGRYVNDGWKQSYRYIPEFVMPAGTVLTNLSGGEDIKVRPLRGDVYIKKLETPPSGITYTKTASDLPSSANLQDLVTGTNSIGAKPTVTLNVVDGEAEPSVIHTKTIVAPE